MYFVELYPYLLISEAFHTTSDSHLIFGIDTVMDSDLNIDYPSCMLIPTSWMAPVGSTDHIYLSELS